MAAVNVFAVIAVQTLLLLVLQFGDRFLPSKFVARKTCHAGSGLLMLLLDSSDVVARCFVYAVVATSLAMTWDLLPAWVPAELRMFRFGEMFDAGITIYLIIVGAWFFCQQPSMALAPLFFADPVAPMRPPPPPPPPCPVCLPRFAFLLRRLVDQGADLGGSLRCRLPRPARWSGRG
eukprot:SAG22_NODE_499_length_9725_cov_2.325784_2_plen_177_part_00